MSTPATVKVCFDTTVLCAAIRKPNGLAMRLLTLARLGLIEAVMTEEVVAEWRRNCRTGIRGVVYPDDIVERFAELLEPLLSPASIQPVDISRAMSPLHPISSAGEITIVQTPHGQAKLQTFLLNGHTLALKDIHDLHVVRAALQQGCDYLCSRNTKDLPDGLRLDDLEIMTPQRLLPLVLALDEPDADDDLNDAREALAEAKEHGTITLTDLKSELYLE